MGPDHFTVLDKSKEFDDAVIMDAVLKEAGLSLEGLRFRVHEAVDKHNGLSRVVEDHEKLVTRFKNLEKDFLESLNELDVANAKNDERLEEVKRQHATHKFLAREVQQLQDKLSIICQARSQTLDKARFVHAITEGTR